MNRPLSSFHRSLLHGSLPGALQCVVVAAALLASSSCAALHTGASTSLLPSRSVAEFPLSYADIDPLGSHFNPFFSFTGGKEGAISHGGGGGLIADASGNFYGVATSGGDLSCISRFFFQGGKGCGLVFELVRSKSGYSEQVLHVFSGPDGAAPWGSLLQLGGSFYGTTQLGGHGAACGGCGTVFELTPRATGYRYRLIHSFTSKDGDGAQPVAQLTADAQGDLYGTTTHGGGSYDVCPGGCGTVFRLTPSGSRWKESVLYRFHGSTDGSIPWAGLLIQNGALIGASKYTKSGTNCQAYPCGTVFKLVPTRRGTYRYVLIHSFTSGYNDGSAPNGLIAGSNGVLYGVTRFGGGGNCSTLKFNPTTQGCGVVYSLTPTNRGAYTERILHRFVKHFNGVYPGFRMALVKGVLYGTTGVGGIKNPGVPLIGLAGCGTLFALDPKNRDFKVLYRFKGKNDGAWPLPPLLAWQDSIYGGALAAGAHGNGTAFRYRP